MLQAGFGQSQIARAILTARHSIVVHALAIAGLFVLPLVVLLFIVIHGLSSTSEEAQKRLLFYTAGSLANAVDTELQKYLTIGTMLAASDHLAANDLAAFAGQAKAMLQGIDVAVVLADGVHQVLNTRFPDMPASALRSAEGLAAQNEAAKAGRPTVSNVYIGALQKRWIASLEIPASQVRGGRYSLAVVFTLEGFKDLLNTGAITPDWLVGIADGSGRFVAGFPGAREAGNPISPHWKARLNEDGLSEFPSLEGIRIVNANAHSKLANWTIGVGIKRASLDAAVKNSFNWAVTAALAVGAGLLVGAALFARQMARGLVNLQRALVARLQGKATEAPIIPSEFRALWEAAGQAADERHQVSKALEATVEDVRRAHDRVRESSQILQAISDLSPDLIFAKDRERRLLFVSRSLTALVQKPAEALLGVDERGYLSDADEMRIIEEHDRRVLEGEHISVEETVTTPEGRRIVFLSNKLPWRDASGAIVGILGISVDITDRRQHEQRMELVMREVNHRAKNMLAVVQAIARSSSRHAGSMEEFVGRFNDRLHALAQSMDLLVFNEWRGVDLEALVRAQLGHFEADLGNRIHISGPAFVVSATAAQTLGMAMHELATNAGKYGALSNAKGEVDIQWRIADDVFHLTWVERNGPAVAPPDRRGFGSTVLDTLLRGTFECRPQMSFDPAGLHWSLTCPASILAALQPTVDAPQQALAHMADA
ncbi:MAG: PAS domain S-box protein [Hyphomicrobiales bacterium]|nr:MAG: PAS domain S-box protein [Hyphomicrobiales bacterium]